MSLSLPKQTLQKANLSYVGHSIDKALPQKLLASSISSSSNAGFNIAQMVPNSPAKALAVVKNVKSSEVAVISYWIQPKVEGSWSVTTEQPASTWVHRSSVSSYSLPQAGQVGMWPSCGSLCPSQSPLLPMAPSSRRPLLEWLRSQLGQ